MENISVEKKENFEEVNFDNEIIKLFEQRMNIVSGEVDKDLLLRARDEIDAIDTQIIKLFEQRMSIVGEIAKYKFKNNMQIFDAEREAKMKEKNKAKVENKDLADYYIELLNSFLKVSKDYQSKLIENMKK